jgi:hypothetical protein
MSEFNYAAKIAKLIAMAEDETLTEEARASYREMAESMMRKYRIAEEEAIATESTAAVPVSDEIPIMESNAYGNPLRQYYWDLWSRIVRHCEIRTAGRYSGRTYDATSKLTATAVGYDGDIRYAEMLFTAARLVFMTRIDARVDRSLSDQLNCYYMRASGQSRKNIATALWGSSPTDGKAHGKVQKLYVAECTARGEVPKVSGRGIQVDVYREAYARGFINQLGYRLSTASEAVDKVSGGLVLHGRKERVDEAFYSMFPQHRPMSAEEQAEYWKRQQEEEDNCADCAKTTSQTGKCKRHRPTDVTAADRQRYDRLYNSAEAHAGERAGSRAAADVLIGRSGTPSPRSAQSAPERAGIGA